MADEMTYLSYYALFTMALIFVQANVAVAQIGIAGAVGPRENVPKLTGLAGRLDRAQASSIVALALFAPAVLMLQKMGYSTPATVTLSLVFLAARVIYALAYALAFPWVRSIAWAVGFFCTGWLYLLAAF